MKNIAIVGCRFVVVLLIDVGVGQQVEQCSEDDLGYTGTAAISLDLLVATKFDLSPINLNQL